MRTFRKQKSTKMSEVFEMVEISVSSLLLLLLLLLSHFSGVQLCWTAHQAPLSLGFSKQEYWSGLPFSSPIFFAVTCIYTDVYPCQN